MALDSARFSNTILSTLESFGYGGPDTDEFCDAVAEGTISSMPSAVISVTGITGGGTGTGFSLVPGSITPVIFSTASASFGGFGPDLLTICQVLEDSLIDEMTNASLVSPVIGAASNGVLASAVWGGAISTSGILNQFLGIDWPVFALAIGVGYSAGLLTGTGTLTGPGGGDPASGVGTIS